MGSLFSMPKIPEPEPLPDPAAKAAEVARAERQKALLRRLRGRAGTISTAERGLLRLGSGAPRRRSLLGQ